MGPAPTRELEVVPDAEAAADRGATVMAAAARAAIERRGSAALAVSGGRGPWPMFVRLGELDLPWAELVVWQVDERVAPDGHADRNLTGLLASLPERAHAAVRPMPVTEPDLGAAAAAYAADLPERFDAVHLGIGEDGHTASLVPGDEVLRVLDRDVAVTGPYAGRRRMTLTFPALARAELAVWLVTGSSKAKVLPRLLAGDASIPAGAVGTARQVIVADAAAAVEVGRG